MIKDEREFCAARAQAAKFEQALFALSMTDGENKHLDPSLRKAQRDSLQSQLDDLREEIAAYKALK